MTQLRKQFERHLTLVRFSPKTHEAFIGAVKGLACYYNERPDNLSDEQVQDYFNFVSCIKCRE